MHHAILFFHRIIKDRESVKNLHHHFNVLLYRLPFNEWSLRWSSNLFAHASFLLKLVWQLLPDHNGTLRVPQKIQQWRLNRQYNSSQGFVPSTHKLCILFNLSLFRRCLCSINNTPQPFFHQCHSALDFPGWVIWTIQWNHSDSLQFCHFSTPK